MVCATKKIGTFYLRTISSIFWLYAKLCFYSDTDLKYYWNSIRYKQLFFLEYLEDLLILYFSKLCLLHAWACTPCHNRFILFILFFWRSYSNQYLTDFLDQNIFEICRTTIRSLLSPILWLLICVPDREC